MAYLTDKIMELFRVTVDILLYMAGVMLDGATKLLNLLGLKADFSSHTMLGYVIAVVILAAFTYFTLKIISKWIYNSIIGLAALFLLKFIGINIPISIFTVIVVAFFGVGGLLALLVLYLAGIMPQ